MEKFINYQTFKVGVDQIGGFTPYLDFHTDAIFWDNGEVTIYASPEWDDEEGMVPIQIWDDEAHSDGTHSMTLGTPYDLEAQKKQYIQLITDIVTALEHKGDTDYDTILDSILPYNK